MPTLSGSILPQLPFLRRFARALAGSQKSGDAYVASVLEALIADTSLFPKDLPPRCALYQVFLKTWDSVSVNHGAAPLKADTLPSTIDMRLEAIAPRPRQAFLLVATEGFSHAEAAQILEVEPPAFQVLLDSASREIAEQIATDVLIIEDEPLIALDLERLVTSLGHRVHSLARTRTEALSAFKTKQPGLILADIQLADGSSGLDAVNEMLEMKAVPVVFITAHPEQLLTGLKPEPTFLIPKPFQSETVKAVISQALFFDVKPGA